MLVRVITALVAFPLTMVLVWVPGLRPAFALFVSVFVAIGLYEYYAIVRAREISPETIGGIVAGTLVALSGYLGRPAVTNLALYGGCLLVAALHIARGRHSVAALASSVFGVFYVGWFAAHVTLLHASQGAGAALVTLLLVGVAVNDSAAYLVGSAAGRHRLAPRVSPKKTWEGSVAGLAGAMAAMAVLWAIYSPAPGTVIADWTLWTYLRTGAILSVVSQIGDLAESCLKRDAGVKDSGSIFPGHGGMLDRCDGILFAAPIVYYIALPMVG